MVLRWQVLGSQSTEGDRVLVSGRLSQDSWEDKDGQKRSAVKIIADVIAPSMEFASCKIEKNPKAEGGVSGRSNNKEADIEEADFSDEDIPF